MVDLENKSNLQQILGLAVSDQAIDNLSSMGLISSSVVSKMKELRPNRKVDRLIELLNRGELPEFKEMAFEPSIISSLTSTQLKRIVKLTIEAGHYDLVNEMLQQGYVLSETLLLNYLKEGEFPLAEVCIDYSFIPYREVLMVEFWYANFLGQTSLAHQLREILEIDDENLPRLLTSSDIVYQTLNIALQRKEDEISCLLIRTNPSVFDKRVARLALENSNISFLKVIWTGNYKKKDVNRIRSRKNKSVIWDRLEKEVVDIEERQLLSRFLSISNILEHLLSQQKFAEVREVLSWPGVHDEPNVIKTLVNFGEQRLAKLAVRKSPGGLSKEDFIAAFEDHLYSLCTYMLNSREVLTALEEFEIQLSLIRLLEQGESCNSAIQMLSHIPNHNWNNDLTKQLCNSLNRLAKKLDELIVCPAPILFCTLVAEFMTRLAGASLQHQNRCLATACNFRELGVAFENALKEEDILKYYLLQEDSRGRSALLTISKSSFFSMLEDIDIDSIVRKLWTGPIKNNGLFEASSIYYSYNSLVSSKEALTFLKGYDHTKPYMYQCQQWLDSCDLRSWGRLVSTTVLLVNYNLLIYYAIAEKTFMDVASSSKTVGHLRVSQIWVLGILIELILVYMFCQKTNRYFELDFWRKLDIVMFGVMLLLMLGLHEDVAGDGNALDQIKPELFNAMLHSLMIVIIWTKFFVELLKSKRFGPFIRTIFLMTKAVVSFLLLFACVTLCFAAIFTSLFNNTSSYSDFWISVRTLFASSIGVFDFYVFSDSPVIGGVLLGAVLLISNILLLNLLIAILSNIYEEVNTRVDSEHRAVLTISHERTSWDNQFGILIFMPSPFSYITFLLSPLVLYARKPEKWNTRLVKIFYVFYAIPQLIILWTVSLIYLPLLYIKGFFIYGAAANSKHIERARDRYLYRIRQGLIWLFAGIFILLWAIGRDSYLFWISVYDEHDIEESENTKAQNIVTERFIITLQKFLDIYKEEKVHIQDLVEYMIKEEEIEEDEVLERSKLEKDFFMQLTESSKTGMINLIYLRRLLPKQTEYDQDYIERFQHMHIPWISKGLRNYQDSVGGLSIGGVNVPKEVHFLPGHLDISHIEYFEKSISDLYAKYPEIVEQVILMKKFSERDKL